MPRLPKPGGDDGTWGQILNDFLHQEHNDDGSLKDVARQQDIASLQTSLHAKADQSTLDQIYPGTALAQGEMIVGGVGGTPSKLTVGTSHQELAIVSGAPVWRDKTIFNIRDFGADPTGATDSTSAILAAMTACGMAGGGTVYVPEGNFRCDTRQFANGLYAVLTPSYDNIWLRGDGPSSRIYSTADAHLLWVHGCGAGGVGFVAGYPSGLYVNLPSYGISPVSSGDMAITLTTPAEAANFVAGDIIRIRTGQMVSASINEPDAETNIVAAADAVTGILTLEYPTRKPYVQEYFVTDTTGYTSRTVTANPCLFGVQNVTGKIIRNFRVSDLTLESTAAKSLIRGDQALNFRWHDTIAISGASCHAMSNVAEAWVERNKLYMTGTAVGVAPVAFATGSSDLHVSDNTTYANAAGTIQINEGCSDVWYTRNTHHNRPAVTDAPAISVGGRGRRIFLLFNAIHNAGSGSAIWINDSYDQDVIETSGVVGFNIIEGGNFSRPIQVTSQGWETPHNNINPKAGYGTNNHLYVQATGTRKPVDKQTLTAWVSVSNQTAVLGKLPNGSYVTGIYMHALVAFNSDGTDLVSIGTDDSVMRFSNAVDVSTAGVKAPTISGTGYRPAEYLVKAYYAAGGSAPTTGKVLCSIEFFPAPVNP